MVAASKRKGNHMTNCFDLRCPKCGNSDQIEVSASIWARVTDDGTDTDLSKKSSHEWDDDSPARETFETLPKFVCAGAFPSQVLARARCPVGLIALAPPTGVRECLRLRCAPAAP